MECIGRAGVVMMGGLGYFGLTIVEVIWLEIVLLYQRYSM